MVETGVTWKERLLLSQDRFSWSLVGEGCTERDIAFGDRQKVR